MYWSSIYQTFLSSGNSKNRGLINGKPFDALTIPWVYI